MFESICYQNLFRYRLLLLSLNYIVTQSKIYWFPLPQLGYCVLRIKGKRCQAVYRKVEEIKYPTLKYHIKEEETHLAFA